MINKCLFCNSDLYKYKSLDNYIYRCQLCWIDCGHNLELCCSINLTNKVWITLTKFNNDLIYIVSSFYNSNMLQTHIHQLNKPYYEYKKSKNRITYIPASIKKEIYHRDRAVALEPQSLFKYLNFMIENKIFL